MMIQPFAPIVRADIIFIEKLFFFSVHVSSVQLPNDKKNLDRRKIDISQIFGYLMTFRACLQKNEKKKQKIY